MKNIEILYFDVDGTLLDNAQKAVPPSTIEALKQLKAMNYKVALCTGRNLSAIDIVKDIIEWDGFILSNGCAIYDKDFNPIYEKSFDPDFVRRLLEASEAPLFLEGDEMYFSKEPHDKLKSALSFFTTDAPVKLLEYHDQKIYNIMSYDFEHLNFDLLPDFESQADTHSDVLGNMEIIPKHTGKHLGCEILNDYLGVSRFAGFGDGENDIEFLKSATVSIAMGNARDNIKAVADYTTSDVGNHGIHNGLKLLGIL